MLITLSVIVASGSYFYSYEIMSALYRAHALESAQVFRFLMSGFIPISMTYIFGTLLTANGNLKQLNLMAASGMIINFILNFILIPRYQALGSAYSSLVTQGLTAFFQIMIAKRIFKFNFNFTLLLRIILFIGGVLLLCMFTKYFFTNWILGFGTMVITSVMIAFLFRLVSFRGLLDILKRD